MINVIKKNIIFILPIILIIYFSLNLLGGNRGLFAYLDKKDQFENLLKKKLFLTNEITKVKKINSLIDENLEPYSNYMVNRYDPPWRIPFLRRNEVLVRIR